MTQQGSGPPRASRSWSDRLFGAAAQAPAPRPPRVRTEAPRSVRWAAMVVGVEAAALAVGGLVVLYLTLTSTATSVASALAQVVLELGGAIALAACAVGLSRVAAWARGPVVALQLLLAALAYTAFQAGQPLVAVPVLALVAVELYLLATPEARLAFYDR